MSDLALSNSGDLVLTSDLRFTSGLETVNQSIRIRLLTFYREWFLNQDIGVRWFEDFLGQPYSQALLVSAIRSQILDVSGVTSIVSLSATYSSSTRIARISWRVRADAGVTGGSLVEEI